MDWPTSRTAFQSRFDTLNRQYDPAMITGLDTAIGTYLTQYATDKSSNLSTQGQAITTKVNAVKELKNQYSALNDDIIKLFKNEATNHNLSAILTENGELQNKIQQLRKVQSNIKVDVETAVARDELLRSQNKDINSHQLFLFDRPIRRGMIPYLWAISVLLIGLGILLLRSVSPNGPAVSVFDIYNLIMTQYLTSNVLLLILAACLITILFLSLKIGGVFG
jgi:hypothetical protein